MNILPQKYSEFQDKNYWDTFYSSLKYTQNQFFQWYGSYQDYCSLLEQLIRPSSNVFHVGCGKSTFCEDLNKNIDKLKIINCDYSQNVIKQMQQRASKFNINMQYKVIDLLQPISKQYHNKFNIILDKGTLDAILPENSENNINKIKYMYFENLVQCLISDNYHNQTLSQFIIISLLQPFVLKTIVEYFAFQPQKYQLHIYQCLIKNSKLQPFLISIHLNPKSPSQSKTIIFHRLPHTNHPQLYSTLTQITQTISKIQSQQSCSSHIKSLHPGTRTKFHIYQQTNKQQLRYIIEILDTQHQQLLMKNTCSIFIVPQGKQHLSLYTDDQQLKQLHQNIKSSRLIIVKLVTGNQFGSLTQIKQQLNTVLKDFIQNNCDNKQIPYITDGDQLGYCNFLFQNQYILLDEVLIDKYPIRRLFLKNNPGIPQCQFKLTYLSQNNNKNLQEINSNILPNKKNMVVGIDKKQLYDENSRAIYAGLTALYRNPQLGWKLLIIGCQFALSKFLSHTYNKVQITVLCGDKKSIPEIINKYLELQHSQQLQLIPCTLETYLNANPQQKFNIIIQCVNQQTEENNLYPISISVYQQQQIVKHLSYPGIYVHQYWNQTITPNLSPTFFPVYTYHSSSKTDNILFALQYPKNYKQTTKLILHSNLLTITPKSKPAYNWQQDYWSDLTMIQPLIKKNGKDLIYNKDCIYVEMEEQFQDVYGKEVNQDEKKNKKKKKKKK